MSLKFTILGCGSSMGVPRPDGFWGNCNPREKKNYRTRCSALISSKSKNILIDTSPDLRSQLIKQKLKKIDKVLYSHMHADQTHGINDLRVFYLKKGIRLPVFADKNTKKYLLKSFKYCFKKTTEYPPILKIINLKKKHFFKDDDQKIVLESIAVRHGKIESIGYIINQKCGYLSDVSRIYKKDLKKFSNLKYLIVDCLRYDPHYSHFNLADVLKLVNLVKPKKTILTNLNNEMDYNTLTKKLPNYIVPAFDGMSLQI